MLVSTWQSLVHTHCTCLLGCSVQPCLETRLSTCSYAHTIQLIQAIFRLLFLPAAAGIGLLAWRRPRFAKITAAVGAVVVAPYLVFTTPVISRYQHFAQNIVTAAEKLQQENGMAFEDSPWSNGSKS